MSSFTDGRRRTLYARVYDRLRKRSQRRMARVTTEWDNWLNDPVPVESPLEGAPEEVYGSLDHTSYVSGVRDALTAIDSVVGGFYYSDPPSAVKGG